MVPLRVSGRIPVSFRGLRADLQDFYRVSRSSQCQSDSRLSTARDCGSHHLLSVGEAFPPIRYRLLYILSFFGRSTATDAGFSFAQKLTQNDHVGAATMLDGVFDAPQSYTANFLVPRGTANFLVFREAPLPTSSPREAPPPTSSLREAPPTSSCSERRPCQLPRPERHPRLRLLAARGTAFVCLQREAPRPSSACSERPPPPASDHGTYSSSYYFYLFCCQSVASAEPRPERARLLSHSSCCYPSSRSRPRPCAAPR